MLLYKSYIMQLIIVSTFFKTETHVCIPQIWNLESSFPWQSIIYLCWGTYDLDKPCCVPFVMSSCSKMTWTNQDLLKILAIQKKKNCIWNKQALHGTQESAMDRYFIPAFNKKQICKITSITTALLNIIYLICFSYE